MFESLFRHVIALTRRGCHKTALECGKLLLGLDHTDPKGALCMLGFRPSEAERNNGCLTLQTLSGISVGSTTNGNRTEAC